MAIDNEVFVGDVGTALRMTVTEDGDALDISTVSGATILLRKPTGHLLIKTASFVSTGTDGQMQYVTQSGDLDTPGTWRIQGYLVNLGGWSGYTSEGQPFEVKQTLG